MSGLLFAYLHRGKRNGVDLRGMWHSISRAEEKGSSLMNDLPTFDRWQFDKKYRPKKMSQQISWEDFRREMGVENGNKPVRDARWIPLFSADDKKLRLVIIERDHWHHHTDFRGLGTSGTHKRAVRRAGSYRAFLAGIAFRAWRLCWDSVTIAEEMQISPQTVRVQLHRMVEVAAYLEERNWVLTRPEYVEGEICWECRRRPIDKPRNKWRCSVCAERERIRDRKSRRKWRRKRSMRLQQRSAHLR